MAGESIKRTSVVTCKLIRCDQDGKILTKNITITHD